MVYPRVGGGNWSAVKAGVAFAGLSPRGRGKRVAALTAGIVYRSIPAWAGETCRREKRRVRDEVYPRVGGGNCRFLFYA